MKTKTRMLPGFFLRTDKTSICIKDCRTANRVFLLSTSIFMNGSYFIKKMLYHFYIYLYFSLN